MAAAVVPTTVMAATAAIAVSTVAATTIATIVMTAAPVSVTVWITAIVVGSWIPVIAVIIRRVSVWIRIRTWILVCGRRVPINRGTHEDTDSEVAESAGRRGQNEDRGNCEDWYTELFQHRSKPPGAD